MNPEKETKLRIEWEVLIAVGERFAMLAENMADGMPEATRKQAQRLVERLKYSLVGFQDDATDIMEATGISYADGMPEATRKQAQRLVERLKYSLVGFQDDATDIMEATGISYTVL